MARFCLPWADRTSVWLRLMLIVVSAGIVCVSVPDASPGDEAAVVAAPLPETFREQLAAGEFATALQAAQRSQDSQRDSMLAELAQAQATAGDRQRRLHHAGARRGRSRA